MKPPPSCPCVLVVDDDVSILAVVRRTLVPSGFRVITAATVDTAVERLQPGALDLILSDVHLGEEHVDQLLAAVEAANLVVPVLLMSGAGRPPSTGHPRVVGFVAKAFRPATLVTLVRGAFVHA